MTLEDFRPFPITVKCAIHNRAVGHVVAEGGVFENPLLAWSA